MKNALFVLMAALQALILSFAIAAGPVSAQVVFREDFENGTNNTPTGAVGFSVAGDSYTGLTPPGQTYTASPDWLNGRYCNGIILSSQNSTVPTWADGAAQCRLTAEYDKLRTLARGMGQVFGLGNSNHVASAYTECPNGNCIIIGNGPINGVMFRTNSLIPVTANRFYSFSVSVGALNCGTTTFNSFHPQFQFQLIDGGGLTTNVGGVLDPCDAGRTDNNVALIGGGGTTVVVSTQAMVANQAIRYTGSALGVQLYNNSGETRGNDAAYEVVGVTDVTPSISKSFSPAVVEAGGTSVLTFTVTNTDEGLAKPDWRFTDNLPAGLTLADTTVGGTCNNPANTATPAQLIGGAAGANSITVNGSLPGQAACTVTVNVRVGPDVTTPKIDNCGVNFSDALFISPPATTACATVTVTRAINLTKTWLGSTAGDAVALTITGADVTSPTAGVSTAPATTTPAKAQVLIGGTTSLVEAFTAGSPANYETLLSCVKDTDGSTVAVTGAGVSGSIAMPLDSAVTCTFINSDSNANLADLSVTKTNTPAQGPNDLPDDTVTRGAASTYSIVVTNNGPSIVTGAIVSDALANRAGLTCTPPPTCSGSACPAGPLTNLSLDSGVTLGVLTVGGSVTITLFCTVD